MTFAILAVDISHLNQHVKRIYITKSSGEEAPFSLKKLRRSLRKAGASPQIIHDIALEIQKGLYPGISTEEIYGRAFELLKESSAHLAARYKLKKAIMELGPSGYPFERFVGDILRNRKYDVQLGNIVEGYCVNHEIDVMARRGADTILAECKYHNQSGLVCDVKISLYVHARFRDVGAGLKRRGENADFQGWLVTNTRFSDDAVLYGECAGLRLISWNYPLKGSLKEIVDRERLYPLTCLTTLSGHEKNRLLEQGIVLCSELMRRDDVLAKTVSSNRIAGILQECRGLCGPAKSKN
ncbi:MAG: ATPase [Haliscomenobacteraceae bacterium CHB4]|nr:hypothetical protein [Saprospiraceae bacterium]MCE7925584.1 ATPase [Haliscomenobacteraceae bacterium CHB4]